MVIFRTKPASVQYEGFLIFPGAQFFSDESFDYLKNKYPDFVRETKGVRAAIQVLVKSSEPIVNNKVKTWPKAKTNIGEELKSVDVETAVSVVQEIIDESELRDVQANDMRREVQAACVAQWTERQSAMERLAPRTVTNPNHGVSSKPIFSSSDPVIQDVVKEMASGR